MSGDRLPDMIYAFDEDGQLAARFIETFERRVVINFETRTGWIALSSDQAVRLAWALTRAAWSNDQRERTGKVACLP